MVRTAQWRVVVALLGTALAAPAALAQVPAEPAKVPVADADPLPGLPHPPEEPASLMQPAPAAVGHDVIPCRYFETDPLLDSPPLPQPGWFIDVEIDPTGSHVANGLSNATIPGNHLPNIIRLPSVPLDWTVAPRFEVGYRLPSGFGEFIVGYRFLDTSGDGTVQGPDAPASLHSRLDVNVVDFDYASQEISLMPDVLCHRWDMRWRVGIRFASVFFDSQAVEPVAAAAAGSGIVEQRDSDTWNGVGPHAGLELGRHFGNSGLSFIGKTDFFIGLGRIRQGFFDVGTTPATTAQLNVNRSQAVPSLNLQSGFGWSRPDLTRFSLFVGYQYEYWWNVGRDSDATAPVLSNGNMWDQGLVIRIGCNF